MLFIVIEKWGYKSLSKALLKNDAVALAIFLHNVVECNFVKLIEFTINTNNHASDDVFTATIK